MSERQPLFSMEELHQIRHALEMLVQQKDQIRRAVEQLKDAPRYFTVSAWNGDLLIRRHMKGGEFTESEVLDTVLAILSEDAGANSRVRESGGDGDE